MYFTCTHNGLFLYSVVSTVFKSPWKAHCAMMKDISIGYFNRQEIKRSVTGGSPRLEVCLWLLHKETTLRRLKPLFGGRRFYSCHRVFLRIYAISKAVAAWERWSKPERKHVANSLHIYQTHHHLFRAGVPGHMVELSPIFTPLSALSCLHQLPGEIFVSLAAGLSPGLTPFT